MALLLHIPVIHAGYIELLKRHRKEAELYILNEELIGEFPLLAREVRRISPELARELIMATKIFKKVELVSPKTIKILKDANLVSADEQEMRALILKHLPKAKVKYDTAFLRWDSAAAIKKQPVSSDLTISKEKFDKEKIAAAAREALKSSDWFRQVGAVLVRNGETVVAGFNTRQPTPHAPYTEGDPRNFMELGADTHLRGAVHAEQSVIAEAARRGVSTAGADIYVTTFPCPDCAALIAASGIGRCYFNEGYAQLDGEKVLKMAGVKVIKVNI